MRAFSYLCVTNLNNIIMKDNGIKIEYLENGNISIKIDRDKNIEFKTGFLLYENVLDALGDIDIVTCNEINGNEPDMLIDSDRNIFFLQTKEISELKNNGSTELVLDSTLDENIDTNNKNHVDFIKWYNGD